MVSRATELRTLIDRPQTLIVPGGGSPLDLILAEQAGFEALYISGYAVSASRYGLPDIGLIGYAEIEHMARSARDVTRTPLIVDCDTGYGDVANVRRTVRGLESLAVAAVQIEDQVWPKRCGHLDGKVVEPKEVAIRKVAAAVSARASDETVIIARTDALGPQGLDEALARCRLFKEAGADVLFVDGPTSVDQLKTISTELPGPLMVNMSETGKTPLLPAGELYEIGFSIVIFPSSTVRICVHSMSQFLKFLKETGDSRAWVDKMASLSETNEILGIDNVISFENKVKGVE
ncbi:MAG TPA: oxaloacetate decarboxylase [Gammaproteobacteria bacterium]|nr:oxaloacetate decarboxylase [Gammaproteobacteria bacterium]